MSADEFDPAIERMFARTPNLPDTPIFVAGVEARLARGSRLRAIVLTLAGVVGGVVAVRETIGANFQIGERADEAQARALGDSVGAVAAQTQSAVQSGLDGLGLGQMDLGAFSGMQLFWLVAGGLVALAAAGVMRLSQDV